MNSADKAVENFDAAHFAKEAAKDVAQDERWDKIHDRADELMHEWRELASMEDMFMDRNFLVTFAAMLEDAPKEGGAARAKMIELYGIVRGWALHRAESET